MAHGLWLTAYSFQLIPSLSAADNRAKLKRSLILSKKASLNSLYLAVRRSKVCSLSLIYHQKEMSLGSLESIVSAILGRDNSSEVVCIDKFLGDDAIRLLAEKLECNRNKEKLVLRGNCIGPTG